MKKLEDAKKDMEDAESLAADVKLAELKAETKAKEGEVGAEVTRVVELLHAAGLEDEANNLNATLKKALEDGELDADEVKELAATVRADAEALKAKGKTAEANAQPSTLILILILILTVVEG